MWFNLIFKIMNTFIQNANEVGKVEKKVAVNATSEKETRLVECNDVPKFIKKKIDEPEIDDLRLSIDVGTIIEHRSMEKPRFYVKKTGSKVTGALAVFEVEVRNDLNTEKLLTLERQLAAKVSVNSSGHDGKYLVLKLEW